MENLKCPCGTMIKRTLKEHLFEKSWLNRLNRSHQIMHTIAYELQLKYQDGEIEVARDGLKKLQAAFDEMRHVLGQCE